MKKLYFLLFVLIVSSCTAGVTLGRANKIEQSVTNMVDSVKTTFSINPLKN